MISSPSQRQRWLKMAGYRFGCQPRMMRNKKYQCLRTHPLTWWSFAYRNSISVSLRLVEFKGWAYHTPTVCLRCLLPWLSHWSLFAKCSSIHTLISVTGSRRLITYARLSDDKVSAVALEEYHTRKAAFSSIGTTVDDLNPFRRGYFKKFEPERQQL